ncbi:vacuolar protein sorting-associated protein 36-like isoform X2 [Chenopodium quinoa]|uniref:vacuolar protein sorting-associated protein 36-like isoform X1 n=1 Tax=Chenopodium quinoa TaxID=63459 RepID=UPI000B7715FB|nr:vacuolar protein sorting-associated protein 36-like isoform X1 [Chenopodium quinoa]XP_021773400.1 vacuolar protein sorting-associated protein 36-like isoform X2 [Chenopodium quinoa]
MAGKWLPVANLTSSKRPILTGDEVECFYLSSIDIEPDFTTHPTLSPYTSGILRFLTLTTHRLIWISPSSDTASISLSHITHIYPPKKSLKSMLSISSPRVKFDYSHPSMGSIAVTLVMRGKSDNHELFYEKFWAAWKGRAWESSGAVAAAEAGAGAGEGSSVAIRVPVVGVAGILRKEQEMWESTDKTLQDAFQDLNALMSKAREMVKLAERMRQKLLAGSTSQSSNASDEEMSSKEDVQELLLSVGIISPVTKESAGALYHQQLSRQLADFARVPLERAGGMINLIDVYCLFNRARGTELISPDDLLQACTLWEKLDVPIMLRKFDSGVMVIQSKSQSDEEVFGRIRTLVLKTEALRVGISASDAAMTLEIAPAMAKEHLLAAESKGLLCRDTSPDGFRFFVNLFPEINLDDMYLVNESGIYASWVAAVGES